MVVFSSILFFILVVYTLVTFIFVPSENENIGDIFKGFATRAGEKLPPLDHWRPESR